LIEHQQLHGIGTLLPPLFCSLAHDASAHVVRHMDTAIAHCVKKWDSVAGTFGFHLVPGFHDINSLQDMMLVHTRRISLMHVRL